MKSLDNGRTKFTMHFRGKVMNTSDKKINMKKYAKNLKSNLMAAFTRYDENFIYDTDIRIDVANSASEVDKSDHLQVIVDDVTWGETVFTGTGGVATYGEKVSYVEARSNLEGMSKTGVHELGHNFGLRHNWEDGMDSSNGNTNFMSYGGDSRTGAFSRSQINHVIGGFHSGKLNLGSPTQRAPRTTNNWFWNTSTNDRPYDFNVKKGDVIPTIIKD
ncbi:reprolysin-like metallopeptidase [Tenacibaculum maritimum]|uniref:reprolysin-like metallopeptidase n=1 Tax=Tenacibaculum maritimum TaxID=107401 RepID=UPI00132F67C4|nr:hypothetical protein [Tenacibaculum maritimum]